MKQVLKQFKLNKVLDYVEKPNDLDKQMEVLQKKVNKYGKVIEEIEKDVAEVKSIKDRFGKKARF
jgi:prefoldin subunit 5